MASNAMASQQRVSALDLSFSLLTADFHAVVKFLLSIDSLESLTLQSTNVSGSISFPPGSMCSSVFTSLDLSRNSLSGPVSDVSGLAACSGLKSLNLSGNALDFSVKDQWSVGLKVVAGLDMFDLSWNKIAGQDVVLFLLGGSGCSELKLLAIKGNRVGGQVDVSSCRYLDISANNFTGAEHLTLGDCSVLEHLDISGNKLSGDLVAAIKSCTKLNFLNVSTNLFTGPIPAGIPAANLKFISLAGNYFHGGIPSQLVDSACPGLVSLDLSSNNLSGSVPPSLASCTSLENLDISVKNFTGEISLSILLKMSSLKKIDLSYNYFVGGLSDSFSKMPNLESLDLSLRKDEQAARLSS